MRCPVPAVCVSAGAGSCGKAGDTTAQRPAFPPFQGQLQCRKNCWCFSRASTPIQVSPGGTSFTTIAPQPTVAHAPIFCPRRTTAPAPMSAPSPTSTLPERTTPEATWANGWTMHSCSMMAALLIIAPSPIFALGPINTCAPTKTPLPISAVVEILAAG